MMNNTTVIKLNFHDQAFADEVCAFIQKMIRAIYACGGKALPFDDEYSLSVRYRHQYMNYRRKAKKYREPVEEAERLLSSLKLDGTRITLTDCDNLQGPLDMDGDFHREFYIQLCFLTATIALMRGYDPYFVCSLNGCGGRFSRCVFYGDFLRIDHYGAGMMSDRYEWEYREGFGGFQQMKHSRFAAEVKKIYVTDVPAFQADEDIRKRFQEIEEKLDYKGRIILRFPSAEPIIRILIEADSEDLCRQCTDEFLSVIIEKGYRIL